MNAQNKADGTVPAPSGLRAFRLRGIAGDVGAAVLTFIKNIDRFQKGTRNLFFGRVLVGQLASLISVLLTLDSHARSRNNCEQRPSFGRAGNGLDEILLRP